MGYGKLFELESGGAHAARLSGEEGDDVREQASPQGGVRDALEGEAQGHRAVVLTIVGDGCRVS